MALVRMPIGMRLIVAHCWDVPTFSTRSAFAACPHSSGFLASPQVESALACKLLPGNVSPGDPVTIPRVILMVYGYAHKKARREALASLDDGQLCWRCRRPMRAWQSLDLDHVRPVLLGGSDGPVALSHAKCNRAAGARLGNRNRGRRRIRRAISSRW